MEIKLLKALANFLHLCKEGCNLRMLVRSVLPQTSKHLAIGLKNQTSHTHVPVTPSVLPCVTTHQSIRKHHDCVLVHEKANLLQPKTIHANDM
jgi:hypothetical protein